MSRFNSYGPFKNLAMIGMVIFVITTIIYAQTGNAEPKVTAGLVFLGIAIICGVLVAFKYWGETVMANRIVADVTDNSKLVEIARTHQNQKARAAAVKKLTDQTLLAEFTGENHSFLVRQAAIENLTDQNLLLEIASKKPVKPQVDKLDENSRMTALTIYGLKKDICKRAEKRLIRLR